MPLQIKTIKLINLSSNIPQREFMEMIHGILETEELETPEDYANFIAALGKYRDHLKDSCISHFSHLRAGGKGKYGNGSFESYITAANGDWVEKPRKTQYEHWLEVGGYPPAFTDFQDHIFNAYKIADPKDKKSLETTYPKWFTEPKDPPSSPIKKMISNELDDDEDE